MGWGTLSAGSLRIAVTCFVLTVPRVLERALSATGRVATAFLAGERGFVRLAGTSGFATRLVLISAPAEPSTDFGCVFLVGTPSLILGTRFGRVKGSGFCVVLGLSAWETMLGSLGLEVFGANAIAGGCGRDGSAVLRCTSADFGTQVKTDHLQRGWPCLLLFSTSNPATTKSY